MQQQHTHPHPTVTFAGTNCRVEKASYPAAYGGRLALVLVDARDGERVAVATVNMPEVPLEDGEVIIKDYSENEGILQALTDAGIIEPTGRTVRSGFVEMAVCRVL